MFDYRSQEATGPWWPRRPRASPVSEASIPRWLLHSCENRRAAPTTNTPGTGGRDGEPVPNQRQQFSRPAGFVSSWVFFVVVFLRFFVRFVGLKETKSVSLSPPPARPSFPFGLLVHHLKSSHTSCEAVTALLVYVRLCLFYSCVSWTGSFFSTWWGVEQ